MLRVGIAGPAPLMATVALFLGGLAMAADAPNGKSAVDLLIKELQQTDADRRRVAAVALGRLGADVLGSKTKEAVAQLITALKDPADKKLGAAAAETLGKIGTDASDAVGPLIDALQGADDPVLMLRHAIHAQGNQSPLQQSLAWFLDPYLRHQDIDLLRQNAAEALGRIGPNAKQAVQPLLDALRDRDDVVLQQFAAKALGKIGPDAKEAVQPLIDALKDSQSAPGLRSNAAEALGKIGLDAKEAVQPLVGALRDSQSAPALRANAAEALGKFGLDAKEAVQRLIDALKDDKNLIVRQAAAVALEEILTKSPGQDDIKDIQSALNGVIDFFNEPNALTADQKKDLNWRVIEPLTKASGALTAASAWAFWLGILAVVLAVVTLLLLGLLATGVLRFLVLGRRERELAQTRRQFAERESSQLQVKVELAARERSAETVSGDFYRFVFMDDGSLGICTGDAEGHGTEAARLAVALWPMLRQNRWGESGGAREQLEKAEEMVADGDLGQKEKASFCMNFIKIHFPTGRIEHANAGMPYPLLYRRGLRHDKLEARGVWVGAGFRHYNISPREAKTQFMNEDLLVIVSDGVLQAKNGKGDLFEREGIDAVVSQFYKGGQEAVADAILREASRHANRTQPEDDQTVIVVRLRGGVP